MLLVKISVVFVIDIVLMLSGISFAGYTAQESHEPVSIKKLEILDLKTAGRIALRDNPSMKAARAKTDIATHHYNEAKAGYLPRLDLICSGGKTKLSNTEYDKNRLQASLLGVDVENPTDSYHAGLSATWILFNGFQRKYSVEEADSGIFIHQYGEKDVARKLLFTVSEAYFSAQLAKEDIAITKAEKEFYTRLLEDAKARKTAGTGSLSDQLSFEVRVNAARVDHMSACQAYSSAMLRLAALLGIDDATFPEEIKLEGLDYEKAEQIKTKDVEALIDFTLHHRPDVLQFRHAIEQSTAAVKAARGRLMPVVWLEGQITGRREHDIEIAGDDFGNSASLNLSYNLFSGGADSALISKARAGRRKKKLEYEKLKIQICSDVKNSFDKLETAVKSFKLYNLNASLVERNRDLVAIEYFAGKCSLVRLNEAQRDLSMTKNLEVQALVSIFRAKYQLEAYTGGIFRLF